MELRQLQYFLAVADSGSFSRASAVIGVAQPALSRHIRQLEEELGAALFYRHGRGVQLTDEGQVFRTRVSPLVRELAMAAADLATGATAPAGAILLGMTPALCGVIAPPLVRSFLEQFPQVHLNVIEGYSGYINEWLMGNRLDMAVINNARRSPYITMDPMLAVDLFYISARKEGDGKSDTVRLDEVLDTRLILPGRHHGLRRELEGAARRQGKALEVMIEMDALQRGRPHRAALWRDAVSDVGRGHGAAHCRSGDQHAVPHRLFTGAANHRADAAPGQGDPRRGGAGGGRRPHGRPAGRAGARRRLKALQGLRTFTPSRSSNGRIIAPLSFLPCPARMAAW